MKHKLPRPKPAKPAKGKGGVGSLFAQPQAGFYQLPELELRGGTVLTDGCRRILVLQPEKVCLDMGRSIVTLYGAELQVESYAGKRLTLCGKIRGIELSDKWTEQMPGK